MSVETIRPFIESIAGWTLTVSLSASVVAVFVWVLDVLFGRFLPSRARYVLWCLIVLRLMLPATPESRLSIFNLMSKSSAPTTAIEQSPAIAISTVTQATAAPPTHISPAPVPEGNQWINALTIVWLIGAITFLGAVIFEHHRLSRWIKRRSLPHDSEVDELLVRCKAEAGVARNVRLILSDVVASPAVVGVFRPKLLLPTSLPDTVSREQLRFVLMHELAHIKRHDVLQNWLLLALNALHWFNPLIWLAFRRLRAEREILCDRMVLKRLEPALRPVYGTALIHLLEVASKKREALAVVSILPHKKNIERRLHMISNYKPVSALGIIASAIIVVAIGLCTLTSAADKQPPKPASDAEKSAKPASDAEKNSQASTAKGIQVLEKELDRVSDMLARQEAMVNELKEHLGISMIEEADYGKPDPGTLRRMETLRVEAMGEYQKLLTLITTLTNLSRNDLRGALITAAPDQLLMSLLERKQTIQQQVADLEESRGPEHPELKTALRINKQIEQQIHDRVDGIMQGMRVRAQAQKAHIEQLTGLLAEARQSDISRAIERSPYWKAKRELENLQTMRERLWMRLIQEQVEAALPQNN